MTNPLKPEKPSYTPRFDLKKGTVKIPALEFKCGDGKIFYSDNCDPDIAQKLAIQYTRRNMGIRSMEMIMVERDWFSALKEEQVAVLLVNSYD